MGSANAIPHMLVPKENELQKEFPKETEEERVQKLFQVLDLKGLESWPEREQAKAKE